MQPGLEKFVGGTAAARNKLNALVDAVNRLRNMQGDGIIGVSYNPMGGTTIGLNVNALFGRLAQIGGYEIVIVRIENAAGGAGKYNGTTIGGSMSGSGGSDLTMPEGMTDLDDCLVFNLAENGGSGHLIPDGTYTLGIMSGNYTTDGTIIVAVDYARFRQRALSAILTDSTSIGSNTWEYSATECYPDGTTVSGGASITGMKNGAEKPNNALAGVGLMGNGITLPLPTGATYVMNPVTVGVIVDVTETMNDDGSFGYSFHSPNGGDTTCDA